jgi:hypothetical protein
MSSVRASDVQMEVISLEHAVGLVLVFGDRCVSSTWKFNAEGYFSEVETLCVVDEVRSEGFAVGDCPDAFVLNGFPVKRGRQYCLFSATYCKIVMFLSVQVTSQCLMLCSKYKFDPTRSSVVSEYHCTLCATNIKHLKCSEFQTGSHVRYRWRHNFSH